MIDLRLYTWLGETQHKIEFASSFESVCRAGLSDCVVMLQKRPLNLSWKIWLYMPNWPRNKQPESKLVILRLTVLQYNESWSECRRGIQRARRMSEAHVVWKQMTTAAAENVQGSNAIKLQLTQLWFLMYQGWVPIRKTSLKQAHADCLH